LRSLVVLALAAVVGGNAATGKSAYDLKGEVYMAFKIEMKNRANQPSRRSRPGRTGSKIEHKASIHNFHLVGPGVNKSTAVDSARRRAP
jgi:hypothetical protein